MKKVFVKKNNRGLTLVEMIIYTAIVSLLTLTVVNSIIQLNTAYRQFKVVRTIGQSATFSMERISREIRGASSVDIGQSILDVNPGVLQLKQVTGGVTRLVKFYLDGDIIKISENDVEEGPLTSNRASVTNLVFRLIVTPNSEAVRVEMTISASTNSYSKSEKFYDTIVIRGSY